MWRIYPSSGILINLIMHVHSITWHNRVSSLSSQISLVFVQIIINNNSTLYMRIIKLAERLCFRLFTQGLVNAKWQQIASHRSLLITTVDVSLRCVCFFFSRVIWRQYGDNGSSSSPSVYHFKQDLTRGCLQFDVTSKFDTGVEIKTYPLFERRR